MIQPGTVVLDHKQEEIISKVFKWQEVIYGVFILEKNHFLSLCICDLLWGSNRNICRYKSQGTGIWTVADAIEHKKKKKKKKMSLCQWFMHTQHAKLTYYTKFSIYTRYSWHLWHPYISFSDRAHMSKRCTQINTHRLLETEPVKIARANHVNFPWSHVLQRLHDSTYWSRWRCVIWLILAFIIIILNQQLFAWLKPPFDSYHLLKKRQGRKQRFAPPSA